MKMSQSYGYSPYGGLNPHYKGNLNTTKLTKKRQINDKTPP